MTGAVLDVRELNVTYGKRDTPVYAVRGVTFALRERETFGIVGESGSGKTTVVRAIIGLLGARAATVTGEVSLDGRNVLELPERAMRKVRGRQVAMIFQDPMTALNPVLRIDEQIGEALGGGFRANRSAARKKAVELLEMVGVPAADRRVRQYPHEFSGGMRQRVLIAIALAAGPRVLLADEPTTALDVTTQAQILLLLRKLQAEVGMSVVLVSHNLAVIAAMCDRVAVMYGGEIVEAGSVVDVLSQPRHPYTVGLVRSLPALQPESRFLQAIPGGPPSLVDAQTVCAFAPRCALAEAECREWETSLLPAGEGRVSRCRRHSEVRL
jgi:peptide/nickel transport system ATP-binding protein